MPSRSVQPHPASALRLALLILSALGFARTSPAQTNDSQKPDERLGDPSRPLTMPTDAPDPRRVPTGLSTFASTPGAFVIAYLEEGSELDPARPILESLAAALRSDPAAQKAFDAAGYREIWLRPCDGPRDMIQRLAAREFDLAFATPVAYARQFARVGAGPLRPEGYEPILQFYRPGRDSRREDEVTTTAIIFAGPASDLWRGELASDSIRLEIERNGLAVSDSYSAAGYLYPLLKLRDAYAIRPAATIFCGSGAEVVKHVVAGLAAVGACDAGTLEALAGPPSPGASPLYRRLLEIPFVPTDPILIRRDLFPATSAVGREVNVAIRRFFNETHPRPVPGLTVEDAARRSFENLARALESFDPSDPAAPAGILGRDAPADSSRPPASALPTDPEASPEASPEAPPEAPGE